MPPQFFSRSLVKDLVREPSDIVHIHGCSQLSILYPILRKAHVPVVLSPYHICDPHLSLASTLGSRVLKRSLSHLGKRIARFIVERSEDKTRVLQCGTPDKKIALLHHTIDYVKMVSTPRSEEEMILTVGRYARNKGLHNLIDAAKVVLQTFPNLKCYIVGSVFDREYYNLLKEKTRGFESHIHVTGPMEEARLVDLFSRARLFVFPALEDTRGLVNLEAMAAGIPVIASTLGSTALIVKDGVNGILVPPDNVNLLVESILSLWKDKEKRAGLAKKGQETAKTYYWEEYALRLTRLYSEVVS